MLPEPDFYYPTSSLIEVKLWGLKILSVNDDLCTFVLQSFLLLYWNEPRIIAPPNISNFAPIDTSFLKLLWIPDTFFDNLKSIEILDGVHNSNGLFLINRTNILYEFQIEIEVYCKMSFEFYPFDSHSCEFRSQWARKYKKVQAKKHRGIK